MTGSFWRGRRVMVTGAGGFIGSWLAKALVEGGADVVCPLLPGADNSAFDLLDLRERSEGVDADLVEFGTVRELLSRYQPNSVSHLAAQPIVDEANRLPLETFASNIQGTWNVLEACRQQGGIERIVVASSDKAYGDQPQLPYREDQPLAAQHPYDASKACADILGQSYARTFGLPVAITRAANVYGGADLNFSRIVPGTIKSILQNERPIIRSDGTLVRDYIYVDDAVSGYLQLGERLPDPAVHGEAFNLGANAPLTVLDVVERVLEATGSPELEPTILANGSPGEIKRQFLDSTKARDMLAWEARMPFDEGLRLTVDWYRRHLERR